MRSTAKMAESHQAISPMQGLNHFFLIDVFPAIGHLQPDATLFNGDVEEKYLPAPGFELMTWRVAFRSAS